MGIGKKREPEIRKRVSRTAASATNETLTRVWNKETALLSRPKECKGLEETKYLFEDLLRFRSFLRCCDYDVTKPVYFMVCEEYKTKTSPTTIAECVAFAETLGDKFRILSIVHPLAKKVVGQYMDQLFHQACVTGCPLVLFSVATKNGPSHTVLFYFKENHLQTYLNMQKYIQKKYLYWMYEMVDDMIDDRSPNFFRQDKLKYDKTLARMPTCENVDFAQMVDRVTLKVRIQIQQHMEELTELLNRPLPRLKHVLPKIVVLWNKIKGLIDDFSEFVKKHQGKFPSMEACGMVWLRVTDVFLSNTHRLIQMAMMEKHVDSIKTWEAFINKRNGLGQTYTKTLMDVAQILCTMKMSSLHSEDDHVPEKTQMQHERAFTLKLMKKTRRSQWDEEGFCEVRKEGEETRVTTNCADSKMYQLQKGLINQSEITSAKDLISCKTLTREEVQAALEATKKPGAKATQQLKGRCKVCYAKVECDATNCDKKCGLDPRIARNRGHELSTAMVDYCDSCGVFLHNCERSVLVDIGTEARPNVQIQKIHCWKRFHSNLALPKLPVGCFVPENIMNEYEALDNGPILVGTDSIRKRRRVSSKRGSLC
eukprot:Nk52_evm18s251 gene=Nk52_evmTU18s251